jgi:hypothetical protein
MGQFLLQGLLRNVEIEINSEGKEYRGPVHGIGERRFVAWREKKYSTFSNSVKMSYVFVRYVENLERITC